MNFRVPLLLALFVFCSCIATAQVHLKNLQVEYTPTPLGMDVERPRFSWQMQTPTRGASQTAYQLVVTDERGQPVWDSKKTKSSSSLAIPYAGKPLKARTRYRWQLQVWDQSHRAHRSESWFETGLMDTNAEGSAWNGARWIGGTDTSLVLYSSYLPVFKLSYSLQLEKSSTRASFVYGANDPRLMDPNKNLFKLANRKDESYLRLELDISPLSNNGTALLQVYRAGYHPSDHPEKPLKSFPIPLSLINEQNKYDKHRIYLHSNLGISHFYVDGEDRSHLVAEAGLNPLGNGGDFIAFPVLGEIGFSVPKGHTAFFSEVKISNYRSPSNVLFTEPLHQSPYQGIFSGIHIKNQAYRVQGGQTGVLLTANPSKAAMPMLRTTFTASSAPLVKARLYATARGIYEVYLNGKRIGQDYFNPGLTQYNKTHLYQTYDVTKQIRAGENALGAYLGEGWWSGGATYAGENWNYFGDRQSLLAQLILTYADGREQIIVSKPQSWTYFDGGPMVYGSFFQGEVYDALRERAIEGWCTAAYDASLWKPAQEIGLSKQVSQAYSLNNPSVADYSQATLRGQFGPTVQKVRELTAVSMQEVRPGVFVYDMGQNMVGVPEIHLSNVKAGTKLTLRYAEVKYPDLPEYTGNQGMIMLENIRAAMAQDLYFARGGEETIAPRFTYHGYRFVEITGIDQPLPLTAVKGTVLSSIHQLASQYETSNAKVNKLWENITWSTLGNFLSIPTDCPQRNERLGWSGDISVFARTATYLADLPQFLSRHLQAMRDVQRADGRFTDVAPLGGGFGGILWGSAALTVAWESYQQYGDKELLAAHYEAMKRYTRYIQEKNIDPKTGLLTQENPTFWGNLGDWLGPEQNKNDNSLLWEAYWIYDLELMQKMATVLGKTADVRTFEDLHQQRKSFFNATYVEKQSGKTIHSGFKQNPSATLKAGDAVDTQTSYVLPLVFDAYDSEHLPKAIDRFVESIKRESKAENGTLTPSYSLMTGFIGTAWINKALSDQGHSETAYRLLQQTSYPSWLYSVDQGATTIWERLNSYTHTNGFGGNNQMNSFNHYSFGAIGSWLYNYSLGIERDEKAPGFKHFLLHPEPDPTGQMTYARGYYDSMYGRIESSWKKKEKGHVYRFVIPANTSATVTLLAPSAQAISINGKPFASPKVVSYSSAKGKQVFELLSGTYEIIVKP
ncbi:alpha-L-rhamnosidase [Siphonobacter sp. BAB-5385]|nr:alpha-L-rhamnosidase [Siphonobacter sp. BAB-5385]